MQRPALDDVRAIVPGNPTDTQVELALDHAEAAFGPCGLTYSESTQEALLLNLAAHILNSWGLDGGAGPGVGGLRAENIDGNSVTYAGAQMGQGYKGSAWGQMALSLDRLGCLRNLDLRRATMDKL